MSATVIFQALPVELPHLYELANLEDVIEITAPPKNFRDEAVELRIHYAQHRPSDYVRVSVSSWRKLPYAYWLRGARPLREAEPKLVERYWGHVLPTAIASNPRRAKRWLRPIFFTYCELFNPSDPEFIDFAFHAF